MNGSRNWIDREIDISDFADRLTSSVYELIAAAEKAEYEGREWTFYEMCDNIEIEAKMLVEDGIIAEEEWERLCCKYYPVIPD